MIVYHNLATLTPNTRKCRYCMKEKTATCQSQVTKWFGGSVSDTSQWDTLYQGFARICSSNNYKYNCRPTGCKISFTYGGTRYNDAEQTSIPANVRGVRAWCSSVVFEREAREFK